MTFSLYLPHVFYKLAQKKIFAVRKKLHKANLNETPMVSTKGFNFYFFTWFFILCVICRPYSWSFYENLDILKMFLHVSNVCKFDRRCPLKYYLQIKQCWTFLSLVFVCSDQNTKKVKKIFKKGVFKWNIYCLEWVYAIVNVLRSFLQFSNLKLK